jgi:serine/threonine protein kinase
MTKDPTTLGKGDNKPLSDPITPVIPDYELIRVIGKGSFGEVWVALDATGSACALKVIYKGESNEEKFWKEFDGVTKYLPVSRSNLGLVTILHVGKDPKKSFYYYTMELADNANKNTGKKWENYRPKTLSSIIESMVDPVSIKRFEEVCLNLSDGLSHLHQEGLVHRDIKPSNVIFVNEQAKLADVGLVSLRADATTFIGTVGYIPPEGPGNPPADIYALGKSLYELLTGKNVGSFPELPTQAFSKHSDSQKFVSYNKLILEATSPDFRDRPRNGRDFKRRFEGITKPAKKKRSNDKITRRPRSYAFGIFSLVSLILVGLFFFSPGSKSIPLEDFRFKHFRYYNNIGTDLLDGVYHIPEQEGVGIDCHFREGILAKAVASFNKKIHTVLFFSSEKTIQLNLISIDEWKKNLLMKIIGDPFAKFPHEIDFVRQFSEKGEVLTEASFQNSLIRSGKTTLSDRNFFVSGGQGELIWHGCEQTWYQRYQNGKLNRTVNSENQMEHLFTFQEQKRQEIHEVRFLNGEKIKTITEKSVLPGSYNTVIEHQDGKKILFSKTVNFENNKPVKTQSFIYDENGRIARLISFEDVKDGTDFMKKSQMHFSILLK